MNDTSDRTLAPIYNQMINEFVDEHGIVPYAFMRQPVPGIQYPVDFPDGYGVIKR